MIFLTSSVMPTVSINLALNENQCLAGEEVYAKVLLDSADPDTKVVEFFVDICGSGHTKWVNVRTDKIFDTHRNYFDLRIPLMANGSPMPVGRHQFPIRFRIPESAPSSYESQFGTIRYTIKVVLKTNSEQSTCTEVFPLNVISRSYFDELPQATLQELRYCDEVEFTCCALPLGVVYLYVVLPRMAYFVGETLSCTVKVHNRSQKTLKHFTLHIILKTAFEAASRYEHMVERKYVEQEIETILLGNIRSRTSAQFSDCLMRIPETTPPSQCLNKESGLPNIIAFTYALRVSALPGIEMETPLIITARGFKDICYMNPLERDRQIHLNANSSFIASSSNEIFGRCK
ncbi:hypothetical protein AB6A40_006294 [Gnathostoma spinigerum]|uniref:Arrestin C-terminal-like domain-containing protein n=1 Tax=Gnathostoma spinigerum TaxID=75299 RepID=A0ABD6EJ57_9BILA